MTPSARQTFHFTRDGKETAAAFTIQLLSDEIYRAMMSRVRAIPADDLQNVKAGKPVRSRSERDFARLKELVIKHGLVALSDESGGAVPLDRLSSLGQDAAAQVVATAITTNVEQRHPGKISTSERGKHD